MTLQDKINFLQRCVIVHSYIYYELDDDYISDREYDLLTKQLVALKTENPDLWISSEYYPQFGDDYNGATGFNLYPSLTFSQKQIINSIVNLHSKISYDKNTTRSNRHRTRAKT